MPDESLMTSCRGECPEKTEFSVAEKWKVVPDEGRAHSFEFSTRVRLQVTSRTEPL